MKTQQVWICDFCKKEFKTKNSADLHEDTCIKNPDTIKFPYNSNPRTAWLLLWVCTMLVFLLHVLLIPKYSIGDIYLLSDKLFSVLFLGNIGLGIIAFFSMIISNNRPKNNRIFPLLKYSLIICFAYSAVSSLVYAVGGNIAIEQNSKKKIIDNKLSLDTIQIKNLEWISGKFSGTVVNNNKKDIFNVRIVLKVSKSRDIWNVDETHEIFIPNRIQLGTDFDFTQKITTTKKNPWWTTEIVSADYYNGEPINLKETLVTPIPSEDLVNCSISKECGGGTKLLKRSVCSASTCCEITGKGWIFYQSKSACIRDQNNANGVSNSSTKINCIGPDGKTFITTQTECDNFNKAWGVKVVTTKQSTTNNNSNLNNLDKYSCSYHNGDVNYDFGMLTWNECKVKTDAFWAARWSKIPTYSYGAPTASPTLTLLPTTDPALCSQAVAMWNDYKSDFYANRYSGYSSSAEAMVALNAEMQVIQNQLYSYGCSNKLSL